MSGGSSKAVVIGASAGAVQALQTILPALAADYGLPVLVVVHVPPGRANMLVPLLQARCEITVKEAEDKEFLAPGTVYFAPSDYHLLVETDKSIALSIDQSVNHSRPSIDVLFETAADTFGPGLVGVVLTGANHDGAAGLRAIVDAGGLAVVEDPASAHAAAMPLAALEACPSARIMNLDAIASYLSTLGAAR